jgi:hypothetical protein
MPKADKNTAADGKRSPKSSLAEFNGGVAAMVEAEVNEGGLPSPEPCDTPFEGACCSEAHHFTGEASPILETCPAPDRVIHLPLGNALREAKSATLMKSAGLELIRLVIPAGKEIELHPGEMLHLCPQEAHSLKGIKDSAVLVTRLRLHAEDLPEKVPAK